MPTSPSRARCGAARSAPRLLLALPLLLSGCSGTPFGEALSRSFSGAAPAEPPSAPAAPAPRPASGGGTPATPPTTPATPPKPPRPTAAKPTAAKPAATPSATPAAPPVSGPPAAPAPYRVTILLPQADPAAPAEVVTRALRAAGVPFEVETIQRTAGQPPSAPGTAAPASVPATPTVRPAPPPR